MITDGYRQFAFSFTGITSVKSAGLFQKALHNYCKDSLLNSVEIINGLNLSESSQTVVFTILLKKAAFALGIAQGIHLCMEMDNSSNVSAIVQVLDID